MSKFKGILLALVISLSFAGTAAAYPLLTFNGIDGINYSSGELVFRGELTSSTDITAPTYENSLVLLTATLGTVSDTTYAGYTVATFSTASLYILDGDGVTALLDGDLTDLMMYGITDNTSRQATMLGSYNITSGDLMSEFVNPADFFALELNLSSALNAALFAEGSSFIGDVSGRLSSEAVATSVPEPSVLMLMSLGLAMVGFTKLRRRK
ncbi:MAG: PEP-CTERM sorting domain-containing protein [Gammaproteobacteria bacterium]|nr:PEP-CTERM sorting domain-containing protein [Gammaproteobacteria bacterium]